MKTFIIIKNGTEHATLNAESKEEAVKKVIAYYSEELQVEEEEALQLLILKSKIMGASNFEKPVNVSKNYAVLMNTEEKFIHCNECDNKFYEYDDEYQQAEENRVCPCCGSDAIEWDEEYRSSRRVEFVKWYNEQKTIELMKLAFEAGFKKRDSVLAGLEAKETDIEVEWIFKKNN